MWDTRALVNGVNARMRCMRDMGCVHVMAGVGLWNCCEWMWGRAVSSFYFVGAPPTPLQKTFPWDVLGAPGILP